MEVAVETPAPISRQPESFDPMPIEAPEQAPLSQNVVVPPSDQPSEDPSMPTESGAPDRPAESDAPADENPIDQTPSNPEQSTNSVNEETSIDTFVDPAANSIVPQATTAEPEDSGDPADSASGGDTSSDGSTRPTSEDSAESNGSTSEEDSPEDNEDKTEEEPAYWADIVEDTSVPDEAELKEIESAGADCSTYEYDYWEKTFYRSLDDPEYRASEKARLTWKIKGVRGTKEKPNRATIMRSPAAYVGGYYWTIKFFPRGNSVSSLSIYVECSATPPEPDKEIPQTEFKVLKGAPDADLSKLAPAVELSLPATVETKKPRSKQASSKDEAQTGETEVENNENSGRSTPAETKEEEKKDWRVSAQIGVILYNPNEPRTGWMQSSSHQFNPHNVDWGWTHFHGPWDQIHKRHHGQRQALLRDDTLAFDAYIQIFDDPTQSLWWHASDSEPVWDSFSLTGYRPWGDPMVNHRHEVAGLVTWLMMASFRDVIQSVDILEHLTNPNVKPRPLCDALQRLLWSLRPQSGLSTSFIDTDQVTTTLRNLHEFSGDVTDFWERLRRTLELELAGTDAIDKLAKIFDSPRIENTADGVGDSVSVNHIPREANGGIRVSAAKANSIQQAAKNYLDGKPGKWSLPSVFHVELVRQTFDKSTRQWNMLYDRVNLDETLDLSECLVDGQVGKYSLYGLVVHKGSRSSGRFYSILRPGGPNTRWLAFEDASDNKIECLTKKAALEAHEGVDASNLKKIDKSGADVAVVVVYIRDDMISQYLTGKLEPWQVGELHQHYFMNGYYHLNRELKNGLPPTVKVELFSLSDFSIIEKSIVDSYDLMAVARATGQYNTLSVPGNTTFMELRKKIASLKSTEIHERIRIWQLGARKPLFAPTLNFQIIYDLTDVVMSFELSVLRLWVYVLSDEEARFFAVRDQVSDSQPCDELPPEEPVPSNEEPENSQENTARSQDAAVPNGTDDAEMNDAPAENREEAATVTPDQAPHPPAEQEPQSTSDQPMPNETVSANDGEGGTSDDTPMQDAIVPAGQENVNNDTAMDDDAAIAAVIAQDLAEYERAEAMETEPSPAPESTQQTNVNDAQQQPLSTQTEEPPNVSSEEAPEETAPQTDTTQETSQPPPANDDDVTMEDGPPVNSSERQQDTTEAEENNTDQATVDSNSTLPTSELVPPRSHVYYFIQRFDAEKQELNTVGTFFATKSETIKESIRTALGFEKNKQFLLWHRVDGISIVAISSVEIFDDIVGYTDGECFIVGDVIGKNERMKLAEAGLFSSPDRLVRYLWAVGRNHPTKSFTGTKTTEATYNGDYYSGEFKNGYYHGKGTHISESGATYTGDFVLGERQGTGTMEYATGDTYTGDWVEDQRHGQGTFVERKTGNKYVGGYRNGKRHGKGISYWEVADEEMDLCQICYSENQDSLFYSCGHVCACLSCARQVDICPMCRKKVLNVVKIYKS
ncbi:hypothetical protein DIZ76_013124 [Coccidioides immitis]|uniref:MORN repeat-containing protein 3 n=1 Tax=Coccidioides immitis RMSCC 2394 TaxID=404692 RepID=A0A0J6Y8Y6_COCIT|nr:MORN repeat-containing protein 3 [Coccidioides immitis RMSCC 2394]TPX23784.1 hypothetical protein DIZ76_013124 [Coccidioides immitis]